MFPYAPAAKKFPPIFQQAPMLRLAIAACLGIVLADRAVSMGPWLPVGAMLLGVALMVLTMRRSRPVFWIALWTACVAMGALLATLRRPADPLPGLAATPQVEMTLTLTDTPVATPRCYKVAATIDTLCGQAARGRVMLFVRQDSASATLEYGSRIKVCAPMARPSDSVGPEGFDYRRYLYHRGITWQCYVPRHSWQSLPSSRHTTLVGYAKRLQRTLVERVHALRLSPEQQGIVAALLLGWRADLPDSVLLQYRRAGILHLLCVSGLHVGLMAIIVGGLLSFLGRRRRSRILKGTLQIACVWAFVLVSGMAAATLRAGVMFTLLLVGDMMERKSNTLNSLSVSALLLLVINPGWMFEIGFQLSYVAVLGIALWHQPLMELLPKPHSTAGELMMIPVEKVWGWVSLSTSAQLAVLPVTLYYFHQFSLYFLVANLTIVPFAGVLLLSMLVLMASGGGVMPTRLVAGELGAIDDITRWISGLPHASVENIYFDLPMALLLSAAWMLATLYVRRHRPWALPAAIGSLLLLVLHYYGTLLAQ